MSYDDQAVVKFLQATHATDVLSDREKHLVGLAVTLTRGCQVCTRNRIVKAHDAGIGDEVLNALFGVVDAGIPAEKLYPHVAAPAPIEVMPTKRA